MLLRELPIGSLAKEEMEKMRTLASLHVCARSPDSKAQRRVIDVPEQK